MCAFILSGWRKWSVNDVFFCHVPSSMGVVGGWKVSIVLLSCHPLTMNGRDSIRPACCRRIGRC